MKPWLRRSVLTLTLLVSAVQTASYFIGKRRDRAMQAEVEKAVRSPIMERRAECLAGCVPLGESELEIDSPCMKTCEEVKKRFPAVGVSGRYGELQTSCRLECALKGKTDPPARGECVRACILTLLGGDRFGNLRAKAAAQGDGQGFELEPAGKDLQGQDLMVGMLGVSGIGEKSRVTVLARAGDLLFAGAGMMIHRSKDRACFVPSLLPRSEPMGSVRSIVASGGTIYAAVEHGFVMRSTDGGAHWEAFGRDKPTPLEALALSVGTASAGGALYVATNEGMYRLARGDRYERTGSPSDGAVEALLVGENGFMLASAGGAISWSKDQGDTWTRAKGGPKDPSEGVLGFIAGEREIVVPTAYGGVYRSKDRGRTFVRMGRSPTQVGAVSSALVLDRGEILAASFGEGVFTSKDGGRSWKPASEGLAVEGGARTVHALLADADGSIFAGTEAGLYRSRDRGAHWSLTPCASERLR